MNLICDKCHGKNKGRYSSFWFENKIITLCNDCRWGKPKRSDHQNFDNLQIPFWKLMGKKPKPQEIAYEKYLKSRGMTYGDAVMERSVGGKAIGSYETWRKYMEGGKHDEVLPRYKKTRRFDR